MNAIELKDNLMNALFSEFGLRQKDGICCFCGKKLDVSVPYCDCNAAEKINFYYQKAKNKFSKMCNYDEAIDISKIYKPHTPPIFNGMTFEDYNTSGSNSQIKQNALNAVKEYFDKVYLNFLKGGNLLLLGKSGTGKTMLMSILAKMIAAKGFNVKFINIVNLFENIKDTFNNRGIISTKGYIDTFRKADFLFLDDLDKKENPTDYVKETLYATINDRTERRCPIIISANNDLNALDKMFDEVIISRLVQNAVVVLFTQENERLK